ncbi:MAG TPA: hypothetical protein PLB35_08455 [Myxococcota bacterium]|nr:hypothetical protein [Myxococcota bacterium]
MKKVPFVPAFSGGHRWAFARIGGFNQVMLTTGDDLRHLGELDEKLFSALSCPTKGLEYDGATLSLLDTDADGRIRVVEIKAAVAWVCARLKDPAVIMSGSDTLELASIDDSRPEGSALLASAKHILSCIGKGDADRICLADVTNRAAIFAESEFNGDGVLPPAAVKDAELRAVVSDILKAVGGSSDRSGAAGIDADRLQDFMAQAGAWVAWKTAPDADKAILPLGDATGAAFDAFVAVRDKVEDYFARCRLAAFDKRSVAALNREEKDYLALAARDMKITDAEIQALPLAAVDAGRPLQLVNGVNPAWIDRIAAFREKVASALNGAQLSSISWEQWQAIVAKMAPFQAWVEAKPAGAAVAALEEIGVERVRAITGGEYGQKITDLMAADKAVEGEAAAIDDLQKLLYFHKNLFKLLKNFVSFAEFYQRSDKSVFQVGTLFIDNRSCDLCIRVNDMGKHAMMAGSSRMFLLYCDCVRPSGEKIQIAAAVTDGDSDDLIVGRNGIFYDRQGRDWDATITKIIENPIGVRQAFWSPYKRLMRFVEEQVAKRAAAGDAASEDKLKGAALAAPGAAKDAADGKAVPPAKSKFDVGVVAALGVAVGGITAAFGALMQAFFGLGVWLPLGLIGIILLISGPSMAIAALKLRQRNLGPLLDANGWAINAKARVNIAFGNGLTRVAELPAGATCSLVDPYAKKKRPKWPWIVLLIVVLLVGGGLFAWNKGWLNDWLPDSLDRNLPKAVETVPAPAAPAAQPAPAAPAAQPAPTSAPAATAG